MKKKRTYSTQSVETLQILPLAEALAGGCIVSLDVAKRKFVGALSTPDGEPIKLFRFEHPLQTRRFLDVVRELKSLVPAGSLRLAMEPTGTYGDAIRYQLAQLDVPIWMVAPKKTHDSRALFDDVQSMHDPKSAVHIAKLCALKLATEWRAVGADRKRLRALLELRAHESGIEEQCFGRIEALLARHWPEFGQWLDVRVQKSALALLTKYPSPMSVADARTQASALLRDLSRGKLAEEKVAGFLQSSTTSLGLPPTQEEAALLAALAQQARDAGARADSLEHAMRELVSHDATFSRLATWMGTYTAAVFVTLCDPLQYAKARQLEKACGLNLCEKSSGEDARDRVRLRISKRGPGLVRKVLYLLALRTLKEQPVVRAWYARRRSFLSGSKQAAITAVMRKLIGAVFHVARGAAFDPNALFDIRRLEIPLREPAGATLRRQRVASSTLTSVTP